MGRGDFMLVEGSYVCMLTAPKTRKGTLHVKTNHEGQSRFVFRLDPRFDDKLPEFFVNDHDVQECLPPSDEEIAAINYFVKHG
jgi:hypothetical protein